MTKRGSVRVVCLSSTENKVDDYLATHIPEEVMSHEEIGEAYRPLGNRSPMEVSEDALKAR